VEAEKAQIPVATLCTALEVSRAGFYAWRSRPESKRAQEDRRLAVLVRAAHEIGRRTYGSPRVLRELRAQEIHIGRKRIMRLMRAEGLRARVVKRYRCTTMSEHDQPIAPNLLNRNFTAAAPNQAWTGDITYIPTSQGWLFLAVVIDLFSRRVVGWSMQPEMRSSLVIDALEMAWFRCSPDKSTGRIFHSDRGSQYASREFSQVLEQYGVTASMSRKGNCWDNAPSETLFASLKVERLHGQRFETIRQAKDETLAWLLWYNQTRMHSTMGYASPMQFEKDCMDATVKIAA